MPANNSPDQSPTPDEPSDKTISYRSKEVAQPNNQPPTQAYPQQGG
jgi:hypothetical protein